MLKALILWVFSATAALGGIAYGFHQWAEFETRNTRGLKLNELKTALSRQQTEIRSFIDNIERLSTQKVYLGLNRSNVITYKGKRGSLKIDDKNTLKALGSFLIKHIENASIAIYQTYPVIEEVSRPYVAVVRKATAAEEVEVPETKVIAYLIPRDRFRIVINLNENKFIFDTVSSSFSQHTPKNEFLTKLRKSHESYFESGNLRYGGEFLIREKIPGVQMQLVASSSYIGWETMIREMLQKQNWQIMLIGLGLGLLVLLGAMLYYADGISLVETKLVEFERRFGAEVDKILNQQVTKERMEAHRDISEGVHSVLKSPISAIRADVSMFMVGVTPEQLTDKANDISKQLDRIDKFIESLRQSNNPGQISQARSNPKSVLESLLPDWEIKVKKYGAVLKSNAS